MPSDQSFVTWICDQMKGAGQISSRSMFGGYTIYCDGKVVALVGDQQLFVKLTAEGRVAAGMEFVEAPPYPGAKPHLLITERLEDTEWLSGVIAATARALPEPKVTKQKVTKQKATRKETRDA